MKFFSNSFPRLFSLYTFQLNVLNVQQNSRFFDTFPHRIEMLCFANGPHQLAYGPLNSVLKSDALRMQPDIVLLKNQFPKAKHLGQGRDRDTQCHENQKIPNVIFALNLERNRKQSQKTAKSVEE